MIPAVSFELTENLVMLREATGLMFGINQTAIDNDVENTAAALNHLSTDSGG